MEVMSQLAVEEEIPNKLDDVEEEKKEVQIAKQILTLAYQGTDKLPVKIAVRLDKIQKLASDLIKMHANRISESFGMAQQPAYYTGQNVVTIPDMVSNMMHSMSGAWGRVPREFRISVDPKKNANLVQILGLDKLNQMQKEFVGKIIQRYRLQQVKTPPTGTN